MWTRLRRGTLPARRPVSGRRRRRGDSDRRTVRRLDRVPVRPAARARAGDGRAQNHHRNQLGVPAMRAEEHGVRLRDELDRARRAAVRSRRGVQPPQRTLVRPRPPNPRRAHARRRRLSGGSVARVLAQRTARAAQGGVVRQVVPRLLHAREVCRDVQDAACAERRPRVRHRASDHHRRVHQALRGRSRDAPRRDEALPARDQNMRLPRNVQPPQRRRADVGLSQSEQRRK